MHHLTCGISSLLHSGNLILFTALLVHLILCISPPHSHPLHSHHLSLPLPSTPDLKLISLTIPFLHSHQWCSGKVGAEGTPDDGGTEGPERAPRGVWSVEERHSPSPVWGSWGLCPQKNFQKKSTLKSPIFLHFCKLK